MIDATTEGKIGSSTEGSRYYARPEKVKLILMLPENAIVKISEDELNSVLNSKLDQQTRSVQKSETEKKETEVEEEATSVKSVSLSSINLPFFFC